MKLIVSLNGMDGAGKTTQANKLFSLNPDFIAYVKGLEDYEPFSKIKDNNWWFSSSTPEEFCDIIYASLQARNKDISTIKKPIIIVDKGVCNFDARVIATLISRNVDKETVYSLVKKYKEKYDVYSMEDVNLFLKLDGGFEEQLEVMNRRGKNDGFSVEAQNIYRNYQKIQNIILTQQLDKNLYTVINASRKIDEVYEDIIETLSKELNNRVGCISKQRQVVGIGGLSESGKSTAGRLLLENFNIPNFKFKYIARLITDKYGVQPENNIFSNHKKILAPLMCDEIANLLNNMYYWNIVSFESLHDFELTDAMKKVLPLNYNIVFLNTDKQIRVDRNAKSLNVSYDDSIKLVNQKDEGKVLEGALKILTITDYIINNDGSIDGLSEQLGNVVTDVRRKIDMRHRAGGMLIEDGKLLLMHRIKEKEGVINEYYVVPGGGIEEGETLEMATKRELLEEMGIEVELIEKSPRYVFNSENGNQYFLLVERKAGIIGTGNGPEYTDSSYANRGFYGAEMVDIKDIVDGKINMVPESIKNEFIADILKLNNKSFNDFNSKSFITKEMISKEKEYDR